MFISGNARPATPGLIQAYVDERVALVAAIVAAGVADGSFARAPDPPATARAILAADWADPDIDAAFEDVWRLLMAGLRAR